MDNQEMKQLIPEEAENISGGLSLSLVFVVIPGNKYQNMSKQACKMYTEMLMDAEDVDEDESINWKTDYVRDESAIRKIQCMEKTCLITA